jgi:hypothetical protein
MPRAPRTRAVLAVAALAAALAATPAAAGPRMPELAIGIGTTAAVGGDLNSGGFAAWGSALWPVEGPWSFGFTAFVDDMGNRLVRVSGGGPPPVPLGTVEDRHRFAFGGGWQMNARLPDTGRWQPVASAFWNVTRIQDDARGTVLGAESTTGLGLGLGIRRPVLQRSTVGAALRYTYLFNDTVDGYMSGGVEWGWRFGKTP